ncbi:MAG: hypothetical protein JNL08_01500 [Planctomycetes bacterium]|nr:hypothetical protein [Planctomycetota bacterium]
MHRCFAVVPTLALLAASAAAQCLNTAAPGSSLGAGDNLLFAPAAMGISFPMAGAAGIPFTHCAVSTNGVLFLTTGGAATDALGTMYGTTTQLSGTAGASPRIAPFWTDLTSIAPTGQVALDTSVPGRCAVTWIDSREFLGTTAKSFQVELFNTGVVRMSYGAGLALESQFALVGLSVGNNIALPAASDLSAAPALATGIGFQQFDPASVPFDLAGKSITWTPSGGGFQVTTSCEAAAHTAFGTGCYSIPRESFYQYFATAAAAAAALNGQSMRLTPTATGYGVTWGGGSYVVPPGTATVLATNDDNHSPVVAAPPLPVPGGTAPVLYVHTNGFVSTGSSNLGGAWNTPQNDYTPSPAFRNAPATAFWSWHDYTTLSGTGRVKTHTAVVGPDTVLYVTWDAVESYAVPEVANPSTFQFQFNLTTGVVTYVWQNLTAIGTGGSTVLPEAHLIGYSPGGASLDPGAITLASALPLTTNADVRPMTLGAAPAPVINPSTAVTFTLGSIPEFLPGSGVYVSTLFLSLGSIPGGFDLGLIGAGGCSAYIASLDVNLGVPVSFVPTAGTNFVFDNVVFAPGNVVYAQAVALIAPNSLPNGQNAFGMTLSNGLRTNVNSF